MSKTPIARWSPTYGEAFRLAWKPLLTYTIFVATSFFVFVGACIVDGHADEELPRIVLASVAGVVGIFVGQALSLTRLKMLPLFLLGGVIWTVGVLFVGLGSRYAGESDTFETLAVCALFFCMAVPSGLLALQHRYELLAAFWPSVGWIGAVMFTLNAHNGLADWEKDKVSIWTPTTLALLAGFLLTLLLYLASKQTMRVELWQALSGSTERRTLKAEAAKRAKLSVLPRRNLAILVGVTLLLFGFVAALAPYLWRTAHDRGQVPNDSEPGARPPDPPKVDGDSLLRALRMILLAAMHAAKHLWPILILFLLYRPIKRAFLLRHLVRPFVATPPSERIDNLWEYVRIAAEDAGVVPGSADSVEELVERIIAKSPVSPDLDHAAEIYMQTRYGFVVESGAAERMKTHALAAARELRAPLSRARIVVGWWRGLS